MNVRVDEPCVMLAWDSEFFGARIGRVTGGSLTVGRLKEIEAWAVANAIRCLYFLARSDDDLTVSLAEASGFHLVDVRLEFLWAAGEATGSGFARPTGVRLATANDTEALVSIARGSYGLSRFSVDRHFGPDRSRELYCEWIRKSVEGFADAVLVVEDRDELQGFITCTCHHEKGAIGLVGVAADARGLGVGSTLIRAAKAYFVRERGCSEVRIVTQARNVPAQRLYEREGFLTASVGLWFHRWFDDGGRFGPRSDPNPV